jgi:glycosyltransferase involved in cell wall biosynthesis
VRRAALVAAGGIDTTLRIAWALDLWLRLLPGRAVGFLTEGLVAAAGDRATAGEEAASAHAEATYARARALCRIEPAAWFGTRDEVALARSCRELAARVVEHGDAALRPYALELARRSGAAGAERMPEVLLDFSPGLAGARGGSRSRAGRPPSPADTAPLEVALEVTSLGLGGLERLVADLALGLRREGIATAVVCTERGGSEADRLVREGVEVEVLGGEDPAGELASWLERRDVRVLHAHFSHLGTPVAAALGIPVVSTLHNAYAWVGADFASGVRSVDPLVSAYTAVSGSVADFCARRFRIDRGRIRVIRNSLPYDHRGDVVDRASARAALGVPPDAELVVQVARIDPIKCQLALVDAVAAIARERPRLHAWVVGAEGDAPYAARVRERIRDAGLAGRVALLGERSDVRAILAAADCFTLPSVLEGLSLAAIEALYAGLPLVLTRTGDAAFLLGEGERAPLAGALVDGPPIDPIAIDGAALTALAAVPHPPHAAALAAALAAVLDDLPARRAAARARREELAAALAPERMIAEYARLLRRTAAAGGGRILASLRAERDSLAAAHSSAARATGALRRSSLEHARALAIAAAGGAELRSAEWSVGHVASELLLTRASLERGEVAATRALERLRLTRRARLALEHLYRRFQSLVS